MAILSSGETRERLKKLGLERKGGTAFAFREKAAHLAYDWHSHSRHQLLYSLSGRVILQSKEGRWLLPPHRAAWIPAGVRHQTTLDRSETISVFFKSIPQPARLKEIRIIRSNPLLREMLLYASNWPESSSPRHNPQKLALSFFTTLARLCLDWIEQELPFRLPSPRDSETGKAVAFLLAHLDTATLSQAAKASGQSARTLRRHFLPATGMTWQQYAWQARMLQAMEDLLAGKKSVLEVSLSVGYGSPSAFAKAFTQFSGVTPLAFRKTMPPSSRP